MPLVYMSSNEPLSLRTPSNINNSPQNRNGPNSNRSIPNNTLQSGIDYSEINRMIENNITRILQNLNLRPNVSNENHTNPDISQPNHVQQNIRTNSQNNFRDIVQNPIQMTPPILNRTSFQSNTSSLPDHKITQIIQSWGLKFDGSPTIPVEEFLYRLRVLTNENFHGDFNIITKNLHIVLSGKAREWFWKFHKKAEIVDWYNFCDAIKLQYKDLKSPYDIREEVRNRKQKPGESFDNFFESISNIADRLPIPLPETEFIEIVTRNLRPEIRHELLYLEVRSIPELRKLVQKRECFLNDEYTRRNFASRNPSNTFMPRRQISEIESTFDISNNDINDNSEISVDAVQSADSIHRCWNCDQTGHHWEDCLQDRSVFCYGCGQKNTYKPQCQRCLLRKPKNYKQPVPSKEQL